MKGENKICAAEKCNEIIVGRKDRRFCSEYCKSNFHYQKNKLSGHVHFKKKVDDIILANRRILSKFNKKSKTTIRKEDLIAEGFNPKFFTHYWKTNSGDSYLFCYDQGFKSVKDNNKDKFLLIQWQDYMDKQLFE
jgi:hypothetical protein